MPAAEPDSFPDSFGPEALKQVFHGLAGEPAAAIAVSGGSDSVALLHLALAWRRMMKRGPRLVALTVDHGLRAESAGEARGVATACARLGVEHHILAWEGEKPATGLQAKARAARYNLMASWCRAHGVPVLLTAHTADDQAETVRMRSQRTRSAASLAGIWPEREWNGVRVLRPLLAARRQALRRYLAGKHVGWIDDPSNENEGFERTRVRRSLSPGSVPGLAKQAERALAETQGAGRRMRDWISAHLIVGKAGEISLPLAAVAALDDEERSFVCRAIVRAVRGEVRAERAEFLRLAQWLGQSGPGRRTLGGVLFHKRKERILAGREPGRIPPVWEPFSTGGAAIWDRRFSLRVPAGSRVGPAKLAPEIKRAADLPLWLHKGLPVVELPSGSRVLALETNGGNGLERLGIAARPTYVNGLEGLPVA